MPRPWRIPAGTRDLLPGEAGRLRQMEQDLLALFQGWSYQEVATPTLEYHEVFANWSEGQQLYRFIDREGEIMALRPEMTAPVARLAAGHWAREDLPLRLCYVSKVFRYEATQAGRQREFTQAGVELLGAGGARAEAEVVALAAEALQAAGLDDFRLGLGQVTLTRSMLARPGLAPEVVGRLEEALLRKDLVDMDRLLAGTGLPEAERKRITAFCSLHGGREVLYRARELMGDSQALEGLAEVWAALDDYGFGRHLFFDFGILRDFTYYSGLVFEGYVPGLGYPVLGGGRYDGLLRQFGLEAPAAGFALGLERLLLAAGRHGEPAIDYLLVGRSHGAVLRRARELRHQGYRVEIDLAGRTREEARQETRARGIRYVEEVGE